MLTYWDQNNSTIIEDMIQHLQLVMSSLMLAILLAIFLIFISIKKKKLLTGLIYFFSILYSVPSFAFFAILIPFTGLGMLTAIIVLCLYCEYILLRTFTTGIKEIDSQIIETAEAMGMTSWQVFNKIQLPLAIPSIFSGIKVALTSSMVIATIAATINAGGLGQLLFEGLRTQKLVPMLWGTLLTMILTIVCMGILNLLEILSTRKFRGGKL